MADSELMTSAAQRSETALAPLTMAQRMLAEAVTFDDFKALRDTAEAARAYAKARKMGLDSENLAAEYVLRAERGMGRVLIEMAESGERAPSSLNSITASHAIKTRHGTVGPDDRKYLTLQDLGVSQQDSKHWQALARIPDSVFESKFSTIKGAGARLSKVDFYRLVKGGEKVRKAAVREIVEAMHADDATPTFAQFKAAAEAAITGMAQMPTDELAQMADIIRSLVDAYKAAREART